MNIYLIIDGCNVSLVNLIFYDEEALSGYHHNRIFSYGAM